jgi:hypothetical protein
MSWLYKNQRNCGIDYYESVHSKKLVVLKITEIWRPYRDIALGRVVLEYLIKRSHYADA